MAIYYINLLWILALAVPLCIWKPSKIKKAAYVVLTMGALWFIATFREGIGFDYHIYLEIADNIAHLNTFAELTAQPYEWGFVFLNKLLSFFVYRNPVALYGIYAALILIPIGRFVYRHCEHAWLSVWLYVTLTFFYTTMNFIRQGLACSILVLGYGFLTEKKLLPYLGVVIVAALFHQTALIMIPIYFLCHIKLNKVTAIIYASGVLIGYLFSEQIVNFVITYVLKQFAGYKDSIWLSPMSMRFILVPTCIFGACLALWTVWRKRYQEAGMLLNLMMFSATIWLFITKHMILERFSMYTYIFVMVALPQALSCLLSPKEDEEKLAELRADEHKKGGKSKADVAAVKALAQKISDHKKYWASAVIAIVLLSGIYNEYTQQVDRSHNIFPYHSYIDWLDTPGDPTVQGSPVPQKHVYPEIA